MKRSLSFVFAPLALASAALASPSYSTGFEAPTFVLGNINAQNGWSQTGPYTGVVTNADAFGGVNSFRRSNTFGLGSFGDQTFSPGVGVGVGESTAVGVTAGYNQMTVSMRFKPASSSADGSIIGFALTDNQGARMWSVNFRNVLGDGAAVVRAFGASNSGPLGTTTSFNAAPDVTVPFNQWSLITVTTTFLDGPNNDTASIVINGGTPFVISTWEDYYRYDNEQIGSGNVLKAVDRFIFRTAVTVAGSEGYYFDDLSYSAIPTPGAVAVMGLGGLLAARRRR